MLSIERVFSHRRRGARGIPYDDSMKAIDSQHYSSARLASIAGSMFAETVGDSISSQSSAISEGGERILVHAPRALLCAQMAPRS